MDDPELEAIRQRRIADLQAQAGRGAGGSGDQAVEEQKRAEAEERRQSMLVSVMQPEARERLSRISLVKPEKVGTQKGKACVTACPELKDELGARRHSGPTCWLERVFAGNLSFLSLRNLN